MCFSSFFGDTIACFGYRAILLLQLVFPHTFFEYQNSRVTDFNKKKKLVKLPKICLVINAGKMRINCVKLVRCLVIVLRKILLACGLMYNSDTIKNWYVQKIYSMKILLRFASILIF